MNDKIYPSMVIRSQAEAIELLEQENKTLNDQLDRELIKRARLEDKIKNGIDKLESLIIFWKKYNPIDNYMQVEQFKGVIQILKGEE